MMPSRSLATAFLLASLAAPAAAQILGSPTIITAPRSGVLATGDLNRDGNLDLVIADRISAVAICLGNGLGGGSVVSQVPVGSAPVAVVVEDLDGDGQLDLVTANYSSDNVSVALGTGAGSFAAAVPYGTGVKPDDVATADMNADGIRDLVTANEDGTASILLGTGGGAFASPMHYPAGKGSRVAVGDWNSDGVPDLAVTNETAGTVTLLTAGGGTYVATTVTLGGSPFAIAATDFDRDGRVDLVVSNRSFQGEVRILLNDAAGSFIPQTPVPVGTYPAVVAVADFNADGKADVAVVTDRPKVLPGDGAGGLGSPIGVFAFASAGGTELAIGDMNHDGRVDLVSNENGFFDRVWVYPGVGAAFGTTAHTVGTTPSAVGFADVTGDGALDVVAANLNSNSVSLLANDGTGALLPAVSFPVGVPPNALALGDLDGNGRADAVTANPSAGTVAVLLDDGAGGFRAPVSHAAGSAPIAVVIADVSGEGNLDVLALSSALGTVSVLLGDGAGGLGSATAVPATTGATSFAVGDLDGDGDLDVVVASAGSTTLTLLANDGTGSYSKLSIVSVNVVGMPLSLAVADVDRDGVQDVVVTGANAAVAVLLGDGAGGFLTASLSVLPALARSPVLADFNGDGLLDLAVALTGSDTFSVLLGDGAGLFTQGASFPTVYQALASGLAAADLDGDGALDLVCGNANSFSNGIAVLRGQGLLPFGTGTAGCGGMVGMSGAAAARLGRSDFGYTFTNAPPLAPGTLLLGVTPDLSGETFAFLGLKMHVSFATPVLATTVVSDVSGVGLLPLPLPASTSLVGVHLFSQTLWLPRPGSGLACTTPFANLVTSRGLSTTLLP